MTGGGLPTLKKVLTISKLGLCLNVSYSKLSHQVWFTGEREVVGNLEHPPSLLPVGLRLDGREVVDLAPVVVPGGEAGRGEVRGQPGVVVLETSHCDAGAALYDGLTVDAEEEVHLQTVPQPAGVTETLRWWWFYLS